LLKSDFMHACQRIRIPFSPEIVHLGIADKAGASWRDGVPCSLG
jgi:hypothetical protein